MIDSPCGGTREDTLVSKTSSLNESAGSNPAVGTDGLVTRPASGTVLKTVGAMRIAWGSTPHFSAC